MFRSLFDDLPECGTRCPNETLVYVLNCGPGNRQSGNHICVIVYSPSLGAVYLLSGASARLLFEMEVSQFIDIGYPIACAIECLEAAATNPADVYLYWLAIVASPQHISLA